MNETFNIDVDKCIDEKKTRMDFIHSIDYSSLCNYIRMFESYVDMETLDCYTMNSLQKVIELRMHKIKRDYCE